MKDSESALAAGHALNLEFSRPFHSNNSACSGEGIVHSQPNGCSSLPAHRP